MANSALTRRFQVKNLTNPQRQDTQLVMTDRKGFVKLDGCKDGKGSEFGPVPGIPSDRL